MSRELSNSPSSLRDGLYKLWRHFTRAYSTASSRTGQVWIDGKPIYRKVVEFGAGPNNETKNVAHGIPAIGEVVSLRGILNRLEAGSLDKAQVAPNHPTYFSIDATNVTMATTVNLSTFANSYVVVDYTLPA